MPFLRKKSTHKRYPYGRGAGFAVSSGERLAVRRREAAQMKALVRQYPDVPPQKVGTVEGWMLENGQSTGQINGFGGLRQRMRFAGSEGGSWEDSTAVFPHEFSRSQPYSPSIFASSDNQAFGRQQQSFWPYGDFPVDIERSRGGLWPSVDEDVLEELYGLRMSKGDCFGAYGGLGPRQFPHSFNDYQCDGFDPQHPEPFCNQDFYGFVATRAHTPFGRGLNGHPNRGSLFTPFPDGARPQPWRGSKRDSYERLRPEDL